MEPAPAERLEILRWSPQMRAFHLSWVAFFASFYAWFAVAPLMVAVRDDLRLSERQVADSMIASVAIAALARVAIGRLCDRLGPRRTYAGLLLLGAVPVAALGLVRSYEGFVLARLAVGVLGASFVVTQYQTSTLFAPRCVGAANATAAGWGNLGGGAAQLTMPLVFGGLLALGAGAPEAWRLAMSIPALFLVAAGIAHLRAGGGAPRPRPAPGRSAALGPVLADRRVWVLTLAYGACFGVELTIYNVAPLYFHDALGLDLATAGVLTGAFGAMNLFARTLGGWVSDRFAASRGLNARALVLAAALLAEGLGLVLFSRATALPLAVAALVGFSICTQMAEGATYALVPFVRRRSLGAVAGLVGAGGNVGALAAGLLWRSGDLAPADAFAVLGAAVMGIALLAPAVTLRGVERAGSASSTGSDARSAAPAPPRSGFPDSPPAPARSASLR